MTGHRDFSSGPKIRWDQSPYSGHLFTARPNQIDSLLQESAWTRGPPVDPWPFSHIHVYPGTILERCTRMGYSIVSIQVTENSFETDCCSKETVKQFLIQSCTWKTNKRTNKKTQSCTWKGTWKRRFGPEEIEMPNYSLGTPTPMTCVEDVLDHIFSACLSSGVSRSQPSSRVSPQHSLRWVLVSCLV